jgi:hypothetical protein
MESATATIRQAARGPRNPAKQSSVPTPSAEPGPGGGRRLPECRDAIAESKKASAGPRAHFSPLVLLLVSLRTRGDAPIARTRWDAAEHSAGTAQQVPRQPFRPFD